MEGTLDPKDGARLAVGLSDWKIMKLDGYLFVVSYIYRIDVKIFLSFISVTEFVPSQKFLSAKSWFR